MRSASVAALLEGAMRVIAMIALVLLLLWAWMWIVPQFCTDKVFC